MKKILMQYFWILSIGAGLILLMFLLDINKQPNILEDLKEELKKVEQQESVLTESEKQLEKEATEKEWKEVDNNTTK